MTKIITYSSATKFSECQFRYYLSYEIGLILKSRDSGEPLRIGKSFHRIMETVHDVGFEKAVSQIDDTVPDFDLMPRRHEMEKAKLRAMVAAAFAFWPKSLVNKEVEFSIPLEHPLTGEISSHFRFSGKIDGMLPRSGHIVDFKTVSNIDDYLCSLTTNLQFPGYALGAEHLFGKLPRAIVVRLVRRPQIRPRDATPDEQRKYRRPKNKDEQSWDNHDPRLLYANQRADDESPPEFEARCADDLQKDKAIHEEPRFIHPGHLDSWRVWIWNISQAILHCRETRSWLPSFSSCNNYNRICPYHQICSALSAGINPSDIINSLYTRNQPHRELKGAGRHAGDS